MQSLVSFLFHSFQIFVFGDSLMILWYPLVSVGVHRYSLVSAGIRWCPLVFFGIRWYPIDNAGFHYCLFFVLTSLHLCIFASLFLCYFCIFPFCPFFSFPPLFSHKFAQGITALSLNRSDMYTLNKIPLQERVNAGDGE